MVDIGNRIDLGDDFGHKLHGTMDEDFGLIRRIEVTTVKVHDS